MTDSLLIEEPLLLGKLPNSFQKSKTKCLGSQGLGLDLNGSFSSCSGPYLKLLVEKTKEA